MDPLLKAIKGSQGLLWGHGSTVKLLIWSHGPDFEIVSAWKKYAMFKVPVGNPMIDKA